MKNKRQNGIERRSSSRLKPWIYLFLEIAIYIAMGGFIILYMDDNIGLPLALLFVAGLIYKTKTFQRLERVLNRTKALRKEELIVQYNLKEGDQRGKQ